MKDDYRVWSHAVERGAVHLDALTGFDEDWRLPDGEPLAATFPSGVRLAMDPDHPDGLRFDDNLYNPHRLIVASQRLVDFLQARAMPAVEFLPVKIVDHRRRVSKLVYRIVHPVAPVDCLDVSASTPVWSAIDPQTISRVKRLVLDPARIDRQRQLFRVLAYPKAVLVRGDLADAILAAGFTGVHFEPLAAYRDG